MSIKIGNQKISAVAFSAGGNVFDSKSTRNPNKTELLIKFFEKTKGKDMSSEHVAKVTQFVATNKALPFEIFINNFLREFKIDMSVTDFMMRHASDHYERLSKIAYQPGADGVLKFLKDAKVPTALVSNFGGREVRAINSNPEIQESIGLQDAFDVIVTREDVSKGKPDGESYEKAMSRLGVIPSETFCVEGSISGVLSARNAGIKKSNTSVVLNPWNEKEKNAMRRKAMRMLGGHEDLLELLERS